jgi:Leucine-rich repeat (LRR) protein
MYNSSNSNSNNTRDVKRILRTVNAPTAKRMMTKRFRNKINNQVVKEAAKYGITNLNATSLELSGKGLTRVPDFVFYMKNLQSLNLADNQIAVLPSAIGDLRNLQKLDIDYNRLTSLPTTIGRLRNLKRFGLVDNELIRLPSAIGYLKNLEVLPVSNNELTTLPENIGDLKNLTTLYVDNNRLKSLPDSIDKLKKLKRLEVSNNQLTTLPESFGKLTKLRYFTIDLYKLISIPKTFKNLSDSVVITVEYSKDYTKQQFMKHFEPKRINKNTELFNAGVYLTNNIPRGKRAYISTPSNVKNNGTLRRVYNKNGLNEALRIRGGRARLHGNNFTANNVRLMNDKNFNLQRIRVRLLNTPLNNMRATIEGVKNKLPQNVSRTDVNKLLRKLKPLMLNKIRNRLRTTPANQRQALLNKFKRDGLIKKNNNLTL